MGQRCYLKSGMVTWYLVGRWVPATWYIVAGTPGAKLVDRKPGNPNHKYQFEIEAPRDAARQHFIEQFKGIRSLLQSLPGQYARGSAAWHSFRQVFTTFHPAHYVDVLEALCRVRDRHDTIVLEATELMDLGDDNDRRSHVMHWDAFLTATSFLKAVKTGDVTTMCMISELIRSGDVLGYSQAETLEKNLAAWCTIVFGDCRNAMHVAEYLIGEDSLWDMDGTAFFE